MSFIIEYGISEIITYLTNMSESILEPLCETCSTFPDKLKMCKIIYLHLKWSNSNLNPIGKYHISNIFENFRKDNLYLVISSIKIILFLQSIMVFVRVSHSDALQSLIIV